MSAKAADRLARFSDVMRLSLSTVLVLAALAMLSAAPAGAATPSFSVSPSGPVVAGTTVTFTSTSAEDPAGGAISAYQWNFGDGTTSSGTDPSVAHTFPTSGTFDVTLTVTDRKGTVTSAPTTITVTPRPTVSFTARPNVALIGQQVTFTPQSSTAPGATITSALWSFGGTTLPVIGAPTAVPRTFATRGSYEVGLTVTDSRGLTAQATPRTIRIHARPTAAFDVSPPEPVVGQEVVLSSYSSDPDGPLAAQVWDLDGDGAFDDASGARVVGTFTTPGPHTVSLRVRDADGVRAIASKIINVKVSNWLAPITPDDGVKQSFPPPAAVTGKPFLRMLSPFPVVRMAGWRMVAGARIEILGVRAPAGSRVLTVCRGKKCPVKKKIIAVSTKKPKPVRVKRFERFFPAGSVIEVFVRRSDRLGKYTRFTIRSKRQRWKRIDGCVAPNTTRAVTCPAD
jgi:PKD repeat protein